MAKTTNPKLNNEWYGAKKKHYTASETISWSANALKAAERDFAELAAAIGNRKKPIDGKFFKVFAISDKKCLSIFKLLRPRRFASLVETAAEMNDKDRSKLWSKIFKPHLTAWEQTITFLDNRMPGQAKIIELRQSFNTISTLQHQFISDPASATKDALQNYMSIFDKLWPVWEMLATILPVGRSLHAPAGSVRGKYDKYCAKNSVLAKLFEVDIKTISRWKKEDSDWAASFRKHKHSIDGMQNLAKYYIGIRDFTKSERAAGRKATSRQRYDDTVDYKSRFAKPTNIHTNHSDSD